MLAKVEGLLASNGIPSKLVAREDEQSALKTSAMLVPELEALTPEQQWWSSLALAHLLKE